MNPKYYFKVSEEQIQELREKAIEEKLEREKEIEREREEREIRGMVLLRKAKEKAIQKLYDRHIEDMMRNKSPQDVMDYLDFVVPELRDELSKIMESIQQRDTVENKDWWFITINPDPSKDFKAFYADFKECLTLTPFKDKQWIYAIDQRAKGDEVAQGFHIHMVYNRRRGKNSTSRPSEWQNCLKRKLSLYCGNIKHFKFDLLKSDEDLLKCIDYVKGIKLGDDKMAKQIRTNEFLESEGYEKYYSSQME